MNASKVRSNARSLSVVLLLVLGCLAIISGFSLVIDPSGRSLGLHIGLLSESPFKDFAIPGILMGLCNGVLNIACAVFVGFRWRQAPRFLIIQGWILIFWILAEVAFVQSFNLLHAGCLVVGIAWLYTGDLLRKTKKAEI